MHEQDTSPIEADPIVAEEKGFWTLDRIIIYSLLAIAVVMALNDYRIRSKWESDFSELDAAVTIAKNPSIRNAEQADSTLVETIRRGVGVGNWMAERGYAIDDSRSSKNVQVFSTSSGIRTFFVNVDVHLTGRDAEQRESILAVSREAFYAWNRLPEIEKESTASEVAGEEGSQAGPEMTSMGDGDGPRGGGGGGRSFDPEQIFAERDKDMDGLLSGDEISERMQSRIEQMDEDKDGAISKDEFVKALAAMMAARRQSEGGQRGGGGFETGLMEVPDDPYAEDEGAISDPNALPVEVEKQKEVDAGQ